MKVLLDENLDHRLIGLLVGICVDHVRLIGWAGVKNGELMGLIGGTGYDVFVTADKQLVHQQNLDSRPFGIVVVDVHPNKLSS
jgi:predicted nuclease of predicted toxin-antitoxin system